MTHRISKQQILVDKSNGKTKKS